MTQLSPFYTHRCANLKINFLVARRLFQFAINAETENKLFTGVTIKKLKVDSATISRIRECAIYEVSVDSLEHAFLTLIASGEFSPMRESLHIRIGSIDAPLGEIYLATLIASDVNAHQLYVPRSLATRPSC